MNITIGKGTKIVCENCQTPMYRVMHDVKCAVGLKAEDLESLHADLVPPAEQTSIPECPECHASKAIMTPGASTIAYTEHKCKHCKAMVMLQPNDIANKRVVPRCPYCHAAALEMTGAALEIIPGNDEEKARIQMVHVMARPIHVPGSDGDLR